MNSMDKDRQRFKNQGPTRGYFAAIPHMADDDLNLYEYRLYGHYKRVCGEQNEPCEESVRATAKACGMSHPMIIKARRSLEDKGYIKTFQADQKSPIEITLNDLWPVNMARYSGHTVERKEEGGHTVSQGGSQVSQGGHTVECNTHENELQEPKEQEKNRSISVNPPQTPKTQDFPHTQAALFAACPSDPLPTIPEPVPRRALTPKEAERIDRFKRTKWKEAIA